MMSDLLANAFAACLGCGIGQYIVYSMDKNYGRERAVNTFIGVCLGVACLVMCLVMHGKYQ